MPEITLENDPTVFIVGVHGKGKFSVDAYALSHVVTMAKPPGMSVKDPMDLTADEAVADQEAVVKAVREVVRPETDDADVAGLTNAEAYAIGSKVLMRLKQLGNE